MWHRGPVSSSADRFRQIGVTVAGVLCVLGTLLGTGVIGPSVAESSGGSLSADATLIAPAGPAFSIWSVIYTGLAAYVVWQWLPGNATSERARAIGWWAAASMVLNAGWLLVTQAGWLWVSVVVIVALALVLKVVVARLTRLPAHGWGDRIAVDGTFGLYLGWVAVATCANIAATLVDSGLPATGTGAQLTTVVVLLVVLGIGVLYSARYGARLAVAAAMAWGLGWIAYGRLADEPTSTSVAIAAVAVAAGIVGVTLWQRLNRHGLRSVQAGA